MNYENGDNKEVLERVVTKDICENNGRERKIGQVLLAVSCVFWIFTFLGSPFLPVENEHKVIIGLISFIFREIFFYGALFLLGKDFVTKLWCKYHPFKKKNEKEDTVQVKPSGVGE